ncbi:hypothetical protein OGM63_19105 [Plectonema radiosum NIES-515]|uniref:Transposase n=1 Tax=Plectonema radiosum NIES-515 TaxID=2986073 RepID=A0ABT3B2J9_9CYAN|nr:hypothetical protein [Plectonema radiosum]MCV3215594.1 hypothetical protein [Plectonema radiosum NIES-515]
MDTQNFLTLLFDAIAMTVHRHRYIRLHHVHIHFDTAPETDSGQPRKR